MSPDTKTNIVIPEPSTPVPWWHRLLTSILTSLVGAGFIFVASMVLDPTSTAGVALLAVGVGLMLTGGSILTKVASGGDQRGKINISLLVIIVSIFLFAGFLAVEASCATSLQVAPTANQKVVIQWHQGPPCTMRTTVDGKEVYSLVWPLACPAKCPQEPQEIGP